MKHIVWGILVLVFLGCLVYFPTPTTLVALFLGAYKVSEISTKIGEWVQNKYGNKS